MGARARLPQRLGTLATRAPVRFVCFAALALAAALPFLATSGAFNNFRDAQVLWQYEESARRTVLGFHQLPWWNPWACGGMVALGSPQARFASPAFLLTLLFGTTRAEALTLFAMVLLALEGAWRYLRRRGARGFGALLGAPVFGLGGLFASAPALGWFNFLGFALLPWALLGLRQAAAGSTRGAALLAASFAWMTGFGGTYSVPIAALAVTVELLLVAARAPGRVRWPTVAAGALLCLGLGAFRLWPIFDELARAPRVVTGGAASTPLKLGGLLFGTWPLFKGPVWYLIGGAAAVVACFGLPRKRALPAIAAACVWAWLALGGALGPSLFEAVRRLPGFSMLRNPERFLMPVTLLFALAVAWAVDDLAARGRSKRWARWLWGAAAVALVINHALLIDNFWLAARSRTMIAAPEDEVRPFHQARGNRWAAAFFAPSSRGSLACWEAYPVPQSPRLRGDLEHEAWLREPSDGRLEERDWSPNRLDFTATLTAPARLVINQNHHPGWRSSVGEVVSEGGLLAVDLPAGSHAVTLRFLPRSAVGGLLTSAVALLVLLALVFLRIGTGWQPGLALLPLAVAAALATGLTEPRAQSPAPTTPEGEPIAVAAPPAGARRVDLSFEGGVTLEAVWLEARPERRQVRLELDWRRSEALRPGLGFFVRVDVAGGKPFDADHSQLSGRLLLEDAPVASTLRDVVLFDLAPVEAGQTWTVSAGLWSLRGDGQRMTVLDPKQEVVEKNAVKLGAVTIPVLPPPSDR